MRISQDMVQRYGHVYFRSVQVKVQRTGRLEEGSGSSGHRASSDRELTECCRRVGSRAAVARALAEDTRAGRRQGASRLTAQRAAGASAPRRIPRPQGHGPGGRWARSWSASQLGNPERPPPSAGSERGCPLFRREACLLPQGYLLQTQPPERTGGRAVRTLPSAMCRSRDPRSDAPPQAPASRRRGD